MVTCSCIWYQTNQVAENCNIKLETVSGSWQHVAVDGNM